MPKIFCNSAFYSRNTSNICLNMQMYLQVFDFLAKLNHSIYSNNIHLNSQPIRTEKI